jgi:cholest-4-en-3-one 26-monooxygenase
MDAPHHTRLRKIISRGFTPRAIGALKDELAARAQNIVKAAAAEFRRLRRAGLLRTAAAGHRRTAGRSAGRRDKLFRWSNEMTAGDDPNTPTSTPRCPPSRSSPTP